MNKLSSLSMNNSDPLPAGTMYGQDREQLLYGLPSEASIERAYSQRWLEIDQSDYAARGYYAGRQAGMQTARCHARRFAPTLVGAEPPADEGNQISQDVLITAKLFTGQL
jgi:hypothetical protein